MQYTDEQLQAIEMRGSKLLVSAAAGSGKTSVLVERIIQRILDESAPVDIDRMLIMTFTKAAAAQMKDKIIKAIDLKRAKNPGEPNLIRQSTLVHNARITTIHGFCLDVIKDHFQEIGLDPSFRVADEGECRLLKQRVLETVLEEAYEEGDEGFISMTECFAAGKSDMALQEILNKLYEFAMSYPSPDKWLERCVKVYEDVSPETIDDQIWMKTVLDHTEHLVIEGVRAAKNAIELSEQTGGPYMYVKAIKSDLDILESLLSCKDYSGYRDILSTLSWERLSRPQKDGPDVDADMQEKVKDLRDSYKNPIGKLASNEFALPKEAHVSRIKACAPIVSELIKLTRKVIAGYASVKRDKNVVDFNDLEHMCIEILAAEDGNTAREYREYFEEIYVDEYQDSNLVQEELLKYIARDDNLFMVGDVKQSIYSFRLARPQLFMDKYREYKKADPSGSLAGSGVRIDLSHNFRSRREVLDSVNDLFSRIMSAGLGGIDYDDAAALKAGASYPDTDSDNQSELILIPSVRGADKIVLEAKVVAKRIRDLMKEHTVYDPTDDEPDRMRAIRYSDIVILLRTAKGWDEKFKNTLSDEGIPVHVMSQTGYFGAHEVSVLLDYLTVLDNPLQDIPMAAVLRSEFGCFDDEELALIRLIYPGKYLFESVEACTRADKDSAETGFRIKKETTEKTVRFVNTLNSYRDRLAYTSVYELLLEIVDGEYGIYVSSLPDGKRKRANLEMLLKKAEDYGKTSYKGLFHFIKYIEMLKKYEVDFGEANVLDDNDDAVRIMTIHKSKGLEFPVCIIAGMNKGHNTMDTRETVIPDVDIGVGVSFTDPVKRIRKSTMVKQAIAVKKLHEIYAEEERVLYVGMTRAKEKLIMTGVVYNENDLSRYTEILRCDSFLHFILHAINKGELPSFKIYTMTAEDLIDSGIREAVNTEAVKQKLHSMIKGDSDTEVLNADFEDMLKERFAFSYPYENEKKSFEKVSVTELKRRSMAESNETDTELPKQGKELFSEPASSGEKEAGYIPDFILEQDKEIPATLHGTAVHRIFELWDYERGTTDDEITAFIEHVKNEGLMEDELAGSVTVDEISGFVNSELAKRMKEAYRRGQLYREQPFMKSLDGILVQGIIDAYFLEDDEIVIVDYKTDRVSDIKELADRYHVQLEYYARALSELLDKPVRELIIYSTRYKNTVNIPYVVVH